MRSTCVFAAVLAAGCAVTRQQPVAEVGDVRVVPAAYEGAPRAPVVPSSTFAESPPVPLDSVAGQLLRAATQVREHCRRVVLENLANVDTPGFKRRVASTSLRQIAGPDGQLFSVPVVTGTVPVFTVGCLEITDRSLDIAIDGDGKLVQSDGAIVVPEITLPVDTLEVSIDPEGLVSGRTAGSPDTSTCFGQLNLHRFVNPAGMRPEGNGWRCTDASGQPITGNPGSVGLGLLEQGFLERSNVQRHAELMNLQALERQHQALASVLAQFGMLAPR